MAKQYRKGATANPYSSGSLTNQMQDEEFKSAMANYAYTRHGRLMYWNLKSSIDYARRCYKPNQHYKL